MITDRFSKQTHDIQDRKRGIQNSQISLRTVFKADIHVAESKGAAHTGLQGKVI